MFRRLMLGAYLSVVMGCDSSPATDADASVRTFEDELVSPTAGKWDTGYLSTLATELEGSFESFLTLDLSEKTKADRMNDVAELRDGGWALRAITDRQNKFAKTHVNRDAAIVSIQPPFHGARHGGLSDSARRAGCVGSPG